MRLLESIRDDVETLAARIDAPEDLLPTYGESEAQRRAEISGQGPHIGTGGAGHRNL